MLSLLSARLEKKLPYNKIILETAHWLYFLYTFIKLLSHVIIEVLRSFQTEPPLSNDLKLPSHIAMNFTNEIFELDLNSVSRLMHWCHQIGIERITLYDELGQLKGKELDLIGRYPGCEQLKLKFLSRADGREKFVADIRSLLRLKPEQIDIDQVQECIGWSSDPDLLIIFGSPHSLNGFPPWQLRLTEILPIPTHKRITRRIFLDCLERYSRTIQRVGA